MNTAVLVISIALAGLRLSTLIGLAAGRLSMRVTLLGAGLGVVCDLGLRSHELVASPTMAEALVALPAGWEVESIACNGGVCGGD